MTVLPAEGRKGTAPKWPLPPDVVLRARLEVAEQTENRLRDDWASAANAREARSLAAKLKKAEQVAAELRIVVEESDKAEKALWVELWKTPQAVQWETLRWNREVAQYVRWKAKAELGDIDAAKEARQMADRLGLNPLAMLRLRWKVSDDEVAAKRETRTSKTKGRYNGLHAVSE